MNLLYGFSLVMFRQLRLLGLGKFALVKSYESYEK